MNKNDLADVLNERGRWVTACPLNINFWRYDYVRYVRCYEIKKKY